MNFDQYQHLRLTPQDVFKLQIDPNYIKVGNGQYAERRIFQDVPFDRFEMQQLNEFKKYLDSIPVQYLKEHQTDAVLLRYLYANKFDKDEAVNCFIDNQQWIAEPDNIPQEDIPQYDNLVTIIGRDDMLRPILFINLSLPLDEQFIRAITKKLIIMETMLFVPSKVETWIIIIDLSSINPQMSQEKIVEAIKFFITNFPCTLEQIYFMDVNLIIKQIGENILKDEKIKQYSLDQKIVSIEKQKFDKSKIKLFYPEYNKFFENDQQINQNLSNPFAVIQQPSLKSLSHFASSPNQFQSSQQQIAQQINQQTDKTNGELIGPLYPLVVYTSTSPQPYQPSIHDKQIMNQQNKPIPTFFYDNNNYLNQQGIKQEYPIYHQQQISFNPQNNQQLNFINQDKPNQGLNYQIRTKYDDLIDQFNWNKYGLSQSGPEIEPTKIIDEVSQHIASKQYKPYEQNELTLKKNDYHYPNLDIHSTQQIDTYNKYDFANPEIPHDFYPQINESNQLPPKQENDNHYSSNNNSINKYHFDQPQLNYENQLHKKFEFGPLPKRPIDRTQTAEFTPLFNQDVPFTSQYKVESLHINNIPESPTLPKFSPPIPTNLPQPTTIFSYQTAQVDPLYQQKTPFSPVSSSANLYTAPTYPIPTIPQEKKILPSTTTPQIVEQGGIKFQDETMIVGGDQKQQNLSTTRDPTLDQQQCIVF